MNTLSDLPCAAISVKYNLNPLVTQFYAAVVKAIIENDIAQFYSVSTLILCLYKL